MVLAIQGNTSGVSTLGFPPSGFIPGDSLNYPLPIAQNESSFSFIGKIIRYLKGEKNPLVEEIKQLAQASGLVEDNKIAKVLEAVGTTDGSWLKSELRLIIGNMTDEQRENLLKTALCEDFNNNQKSLGYQCMNLMTLKHMRTLSGKVAAEFKEVKAIADKFNEIEQIIKKYKMDDVRIQSLNNSNQFILFRIIKNFIHTIAIAFHLLELEKQPNSYFETKYMLDIYWRLLEIPIKIIKFIFYTIVSPLVSIPVIIVGTIISTVALYVFKKHFNKRPDNLPDPCRNLNAEVKNGEIQEPFGSQEEVDEILKALAANNETARKHPLLKGERGIGKTKKMEQVAWRLVHGNVPDNLKGKTLFYIDCAELNERIKKSQSGFELQDPIDQIKAKIDGYQKELIIALDDIHKLENLQRLSSFLDTSSSKNPFYVIAITNPEDYKKSIEKTDLDRRFEKLPMQPASLDQTLTILRHMNRKYGNNIAITEKTLKDIYSKTNNQLKHRFQPDKATLVMSKALEKVFYLQRGGKFNEELHVLVQAKENFDSQLAREKLHGISILSNQTQQLLDKLKAKDSEIQEKREAIKQKQKDSEQFEQLKKQREWHEKWLYSMSEQISKDAKNDKDVPEMLEKIYLFNSFILMPQLDKFIQEFVETKKLEVEITEDMITEMVNYLEKNEKNYTDVNKNLIGENDL